MKRVIVKTSLHEKKKDRQFWLTKSYSERLTALEELRREYHQWKYNAEPRLQRVYSILKR